MHTTSWMSSHGLTAADAKAGYVWVFERTPDDGDGVIVWRIEADAGMEVGQLVRELAARYAPAVARRSPEQHARALRDHVAGLDLPVRIVVEHADRLPPRTLGKMRGLSEELAPVLLVGDLMTVGAKMRGRDGFIGWARFCVPV